MKYLILSIASALFVGCATKPAADGTPPAIADAEFVATVAALELSENKKDRAALTEISTVLDVFCNEKQVDSLALVGLFKDRIGKVKSRRVAILLLLLDRAGAEINPSDFVQWGNLSCALRRGIKFGLGLNQ